MGMNEMVGDSRYSFTQQFLMASALQVRLAAEIERKPVTEILEDDRIAHRAFAVGAIMQATAALESAVWEVMAHGSGIDAVSSEFLSPLAVDIDKKFRPLNRYCVVLRLLHKEEMERGNAPWQDAELLMQLRNEITHYKAPWRSDQEKVPRLKTLLNGLRTRQIIVPPPFVAGDARMFPEQVLSARTGAWAVRASLAFIDTFHEKLDAASPLTRIRERLENYLTL